MLEFYQAIQSWHTPFWDGLFIALSFLGSEPVYIFLFAVLFWNIDKRFGFRLAVLFLFSMTLNSWLKDVFHFTRPIGQRGIRSLYLSSATGYSFPSGHSQAAATFYPYLMTYLKQWQWKVLGILMILGIGFSRLYLGVHWPGDVLGGYALGLILVLIYVPIDRKLFKLPFSLTTKLSLSVVLPFLLLFIYHSRLGFELNGFLIGFTSGYFLEDTFLDYRERTRPVLSVYKTVLGFIVLLLWIFLWRPLTHQVISLNLPVYIGAGLWTAFGAPYLFRKFGWESEDVHKASDQE